MKTVTILLFWLMVSLVFPSQISAQVVINEVMPNPTGSDTDNEWLELYNTASSNLDLNSYILRDAGGASLTIDSSKVDGTTQISGNGFLIVRRNGHTTFSLNNDTDTIFLYQTDGSTLVDSFSYTDSTENKTWGRIPDGGGIYSSMLVATPGLANQIPSSPTSTPAPTKTTSTVLINKAKDQDGNELNNIKIYLDGNYTGNYTDETYTFCDGCTCGTSKVACGFGSHTFRTERSGYSDWSESKTIDAGNTYSFSPVMPVVSAAASTPVPATSTPTSASTAKATPKISPSVDLEPTNQNLPDLVLGLRDELKSEEPKDEQELEGKKFPVMGLVLVVLGAGSFGGAGWLFIKKRRDGIQSNDDTKS